MRKKTDKKQEGAKKDTPPAPETVSPVLSAAPMSLSEHLSRMMSAAASEKEKAESKQQAAFLSASIDKYKDTITNLAETKTDLSVLQAVVSEYLQDFMIVGHTIMNQRVIVRSAKNPKDLDALNELVKKTLIHLLTEEGQG